MKKIIVGFLLISGLNVAQASHINIVQNGDFSAGGADWTLTGNTSYNSYNNNWNNGATGSSNAVLSQTLNTTAGSYYELTFTETQTSSGYQEFAVLWNGAQIFFNNVGNDTSNNYIFTNLLATDTQTVFSFNNRNDAAYNVLDNVSVSAVPVPAAIWLFGTGLLSLTGFSRKRNAT